MTSINIATILFILIIPLHVLAQHKEGSVYIFSDDRFILDSSGYHGQTAVDTLYDVNKKVLSIGPVALEKDGSKSTLRVGLWNDYYLNGAIKSQGNFQIDSYIDCCVDGPCRFFRNYKIGRWVYYYDNRQVKAEGIYRVKKQFVRTNCEGGDKTYKSYVSALWLYFTDTGIKTRPTNKLVAELEDKCR